MNQAETYDSIVPFYTLSITDSTAQDEVQNETEDYLLLCNDSVFSPFASDTTITRQSMFAQNTHHATSVNPETRYQNENVDWTFGLFVVLLALMSLYINSRKFKLKDIFLSLFDIRVMERISRESNIKSWSMLPMVGIYLAGVAFTATTFAQQWSYLTTNASDITHYLTVFGILAAYITIKNGITHLLGSVFDDKYSTSLYVVNSHLFHFVGAIVLTPLLMLIQYGTAIHSYVLNIAIIIIVILFLIKLLRGFQLILTNSKTSKLYLFYYLCIIEIVPILVTTKIILY